jgi:HPt (histidine-containing phosphotransfer) domain-containing protein
MDDYLAKPVKSADLRAVLTRWLPINNEESVTTGGKEDPFSDDTSSTPIRSEPSERPTTARYRRLIQQSEELDVTVIEDLLAQGGISLVSSLSESLRQDAFLQLPALEQAVADNNGVVAAAAAHRLKGAAWSLGLRALASACLALEHALDLGMADTTRLYHEVAKAYERGQAALDRIVTGKPGA